MNCKQGDLARIVAPGEPAHGYIVRCIKLIHRARDQHGRVLEGDFWLIDPHPPCKNGERGDAARDKNLRPIRDPGDDAIDESKAWLPPVPTKELA